MREMMNRAANPSRTLELARNYIHQGVYIEHGDKDENVPVTEARSMQTSRHVSSRLRVFRGTGRSTLAWRRFRKNLQLFQMARAEGSTRPTGA